MPHILKSGFKDGLGPRNNDNLPNHRHSDALPNCFLPRRRPQLATNLQLNGLLPPHWYGAYIFQHLHGQRDQSRGDRSKKDCNQLLENLVFHRLNCCIACWHHLSNGHTQPTPTGDSHLQIVQTRSYDKALQDLQNGKNFSRSHGAIQGVIENKFWPGASHQHRHIFCILRPHNELPIHHPFCIPRRGPANLAKARVRIEDIELVVFTVALFRSHHYCYGGLRRYWTGDRCRAHFCHYSDGHWRYRIHIHFGCAQFNTLQLWLKSGDSPGAPSILLAAAPEDTNSVGPC